MTPSKLTVVAPRLMTDTGLAIASGAYTPIHCMGPKLLRGVSTFDAGQADYLAQATANFTTGQQPYPATNTRFLALFTVAPTSDAGTGGTEVSGGSYARVQIAGALTMTGTWTTSSTSITLNATAPAWLTSLGTNGSGANVYDVTKAANIGTVSSISSATVTLGSTASSASNGASDSCMFSAFPAASASSGTEPAVTPVTVTNGASITFPAATANWGTVIAFAIYDAVSSGNMLMWDYIGNFNWIPCSISSASPGVMLSHTHGYASGDALIATAKFGGTTPSFSQSNFTPATTDYCLKMIATNSTADAFSVSNNGTNVNTSATGDMMFRKIVQQSIPSGVTASFAASTLTLNVA